MADEKPKRERGKKPKEPRAPNPWTTPDPPDKGDDDINVTYASVGRALSAWEAFESQLARVFASLVGGPGMNRVAERAYGAVRTFEGRADMLAEAAETNFDWYQGGPHAEAARRFNSDIRSLINEARNNASPKRNEIAHGIVEPYWSFFPPSGPRRPLRRLEGYVLGPPVYWTKKRELQTIPVGTYTEGEPPTAWLKTNRSAYAYASSQIDHFGNLFKALLMPSAALFIDRLRKPPPWS